MEVLIMIFDALIIGWILIYSGTKLIDRKINYRSSKFWIYYFLFTIYMYFSYLATDNFIRIISNFIMYSFIFSKIHSIALPKSIIASFVANFYIFIAELIFGIVIISVFKFNIEQYSEIYFLNVAGNFFITIIMYFLVRIKPLTNFLQKTISNIDNKNRKIYIVFSFLVLITFTLLLYYIYFDINLVWSLVLCIFLIVIFIAITIGLFNEKVHNEKLQSEYDVLLDNLSEYEKMYDLQRMKNHENKNDLLIIRGMIGKNNTKALKYIDDIVSIQNTKKQNILDNLKKIPEGGLRGILYYKFLEMQKVGINPEFDISTKYNIKTYNDLSEDIKVKICKLLGIYLDNAIDATVEMEEKNIYVDINENNDYIIFRVINNFNKNIDLEKIHEKGYTTKKKGNGYGLAIAKEIIDSEPLINNQIKIVRDKFVQEIRIKKCS